MTPATCQLGGLLVFLVMMMTLEDGDSGLIHFCFSILASGITGWLIYRLLLAVGSIVVFRL